MFRLTITFLIILRLRSTLQMCWTAEDPFASYYGQSVNSLFEVNLNISHKSDNEHESGEKRIVHRLSQRELCLHLLTIIENSWEVKLSSDAVCRIKRRKSDGSMLRINLVIILPQYRLFWSNIYNNNDDFKLTMKTLWKDSGSKREHWKILSVALPIVKLGQLTSVGIFRGYSKYNLFPELAGRKVTTIGPDVSSEYGSVTCQQTNQNLIAADPGLANIFAGCWTTMTNADPERVYANQYMFYSWHAVEKTGLYSSPDEFLGHVLNELFKTQLPPTRNLFNVLEVSRKFKDDIILTRFVGYLVNRSGSVGWDRKYRLTYTQLYKDTIGGVEAQLIAQITAGSSQLGDAVTAVKTIKIRQQKQKVQLAGYMLVSATKLKERGIAPKKLREDLEAAWSYGETLVASNFIKDVVFEKRTNSESGHDVPAPYEMPAFH